MRGYFAYELYGQMKKNKDIILVVGDLGYKVWDHVRDEMPKQFINVGAAEQTMLDVAVGLALSDKIPVVYSITPFVIYRPFETIRTYINHEGINVKLIGSGRDRDYSHDGISHHSEDDREIMGVFKNIVNKWPSYKGEIPELVNRMLNDKSPWYINLKR